MSNYVFAYHGGKKPESPEEGTKLMVKWKAWVGGLGDAVVNPGSPLGMSKTVSSDGVSDDGGSNPLSGLSRPDQKGATGPDQNRASLVCLSCGCGRLSKPANARVITPLLIREFWIPIPTHTRIVVRSTISCFCSDR